MSVSVMNWNEEQVQLLKDTICKGASNDEFQLFLHACKRSGLDPFARQIYLVKRWDSNLKKEAMTVQTGIDGYRLIAERTGKYSPGKAPEFRYDENGKIVAATAFVKKQTSDGTWHEISAEAFFDEYASLKKDGTPMHMWASKPHIMIAKCAEALALRKAFPAELSGLYTNEEMDQANYDHIPEATPKSEPEEDTEAEGFWGMCNTKELDSKVVVDYIDSMIHANPKLTRKQISGYALKNPDSFVKALKEFEQFNQDEIAF